MHAHAFGGIISSNANLCELAGLPQQLRQHIGTVLTFYRAYFTDRFWATFGKIRSCRACCIRIRMKEFCRHVVPITKVIWRPACAKNQWSLFRWANVSIWLHPGYIQIRNSESSSSWNKRDNGFCVGCMSTSTVPKLNLKNCPIVFKMRLQYKRFFRRLVVKVS